MIRREFLTATAAAAAAATALGWKDLLAHPRADDAVAPPGPAGPLFFNFAHEPDAHTATYHLVAGGRRYPLRSVRRSPRVLGAARAHNAFLRQLPDESVTHFVPALQDPEKFQLCYVMKNSDRRSGRWSMSSFFIHNPLEPVRQAHALALASGGPLAHSAKRKLYGLAAAVTEQDFVEEESLKDVTDHATALLALHPDVLCGEPAKAAYIHKHHIQGGGLSGLVLTLAELGEAQPEQGSELGSQNATGWATLRPLPDPDSQGPPRALLGNNKGLILYTPQWHPDVKSQAVFALNGILRNVKNDPTLGADLTSAIDTNGTPPDLTGTIWHRRDGITRIEQPFVETAQASEQVQYTLTPATPFNGYQCTAKVTPGEGDNVTVELTFTNWYIRWLGLWIQFLDAQGHVIAVKDLPPPFNGHFGGTETEVLVGTVSPEWTIFGIPLERATTVFAFEWPGVARSARVLAGGLGRGPNLYPGSVNPGEALTVVFNFITPTVLMAIGASQSLNLIQKQVIAPLVNEVLKDLALLFVDAQSQQGLANILGAFWKALVGQVGKQVPRELTLLLGRFVTRSVQFITAAEFEDAIPIAGEIAQWVGVLGALAELAEATADVALSPRTYVSTLTLTHDVNVTIKPDPRHGLTPAGATECFVTALFDSGATPRVLSVPLSEGRDQIPVVFQSVPRGGKITLSAGFYQRVGGDPHHILLGQANSGLVDNLGDHFDPLVTTELPHPINPTTVYRHSRKTRRVFGNHTWDLLPAPTENADPLSRHPASDLCQQQPGSLCGFGSLTVRQGSSATPGSLGYAWTGYGSGCGGGTGDFDRLSNWPGPDAEGFYATVRCGLGPGARIAYSLLGQPAANFYLDPDAKLIRRVRLDQERPFEGFDDTTKNLAWGKLNFESTGLILHPTGTLVSISGEHHRLETLKMPDAPLSLEEAANHLAAVHGGFGRRPGRLDTPAAAAVSPDGVILVLEIANNRIQAFDIGGNAVPFFKKQPEPYFLALTETAGGDTVYRDLAVEHTGYIYVLSYNQSHRPYPYRLDVYGPDQSGTGPISTTHDFNAARIAVDFWRTVYALNYETVKNEDGSLPALTEPSVSEWVPQG